MFKQNAIIEQIEKSHQTTIKKNEIKLAQFQKFSKDSFKVTGRVFLRVYFRICKSNQEGKKNFQMYR